MKHQPGNEIMGRLRKSISIDRDSYTALQFSDPFVVLVSTILSQNTSDRNSSLATRRFVEKTGADPRAVIKAGEKGISEIIKSSGMHNQKARTVIRAAKWVVERYDGDLSRSRNDDPRNVKSELMKIKGIGPKTADVFLLFYLGARAFPVDVHIKRVSSRLKLAEGDYSAVSGKLLDLFEDPLESHLMLIALGRKYCRPRAPKCGICPLKDICPSAGTIP
ncbi:MAG: endonuclease III [Nitrososphaerota archaeon]|jgi:endonuclease-3|nr:endonuclease III [Nitrososphaerota archaeon]MDG6932983.1 endonuclease III [Nitrososphaerota archaeon]MDG6935715.1 endonuclease III [Nitrososphaerota archaeon]MDG6943397.1 endonuclease III [Nitrososphaerota archaeon]